MKENYKNKIILGDALKVLKNIPDNTAEIAFTSIPYNHKHLVRYDKKKNKYYHQKIYNKYEDNVGNYFDFMDTIVGELLRVTKHNVFFNIQFFLNNKLDIINLLHKYQKNVKDIIIWNKTQVSPSINPTQLSSQFEFIFVFSSEENCKSKPFNYAFFNNRKKGQWNTNVITGNNASQDKRKLGKELAHYGIFPEYLVKWILDRFTKKGDLIIDPCFGSGSVGVVAKKYGRNYLGIEIDESYVKFAKDRIKKTQSLSKWW